MTRKPRQQRSLYKVELILEAAMRVLDQGGFERFTTNAVAAAAGISIGTLYQYFKNKESILDALADREISGMIQRIMSVVQARSELTLEDRVSRIVQAVTESYGNRSKVHRLISEYSLQNGISKLQPLFEQGITLLTSDAQLYAAGPKASSSRADAFVMTYAFFGVMRAVIWAPGSETPPQAEIEQAIARMLTGFANRNSPS